MHQFAVGSLLNAHTAIQTEFAAILKGLHSSGKVADYFRSQVNPTSRAQAAIGLLESSGASPFFVALVSKVMQQGYLRDLEIINDHYLELLSMGNKEVRLASSICSIGACLALVLSFVLPVIHDCRPQYQSHTHLALISSSSSSSSSSSPSSLSSSHRCRCRLALQVKGVVVSADKLDADEQEKVRSALAKTLPGQKLVLDFKIDESVLGGLSVQVGSNYADFTLRKRLNVLVDRQAGSGGELQPLVKPSTETPAAWTWAAEDVRKVSAKSL